MLGPAVEGANSDDTGATRRKISADDRLQTHDNLRPQDNRIHTRVWTRTVGADALNQNIDSICPRVSRRLGRRY